MAFNDVYESVTWWQENLERAACVLHYIVVGGDNMDTADKREVARNLADYVNTCFETICDYLQSTVTSQLCTQARCIGPVVGPSDIGFSTGVGDLSGESLGAQEALLVQKFSTQPGARGRGRMYIPFINEGIVVDGRFNISIFTSIDDYMNDLLLDDFLLATVGVTLTGGVLSRADSTCYPLTSWDIRPATATQRRRVDPLSTWSTVE